MEKKEIYKCEVCGNVVELETVGGGALVCCGEEMKLLEEQTDDSSTEKHVPYIEKNGDEVVVKIGENNSHPMEKEHYIEWIELIADGEACRKFLEPGDDPEAVFQVGDVDELSAREYCNVHELWKS